MATITTCDAAGCGATLTDAESKLGKPDLCDRCRRAAHRHMSSWLADPAAQSVARDEQRAEDETAAARSEQEREQNTEKLAEARRAAQARLFDRVCSKLAASIGADVVELRDAIAARMSAGASLRDAARAQVKAISDARRVAMVKPADPPMPPEKKAELREKIAAERAARREESDRRRAIRSKRAKDRADRAAAKRKTPPRKHANEKK